MSSRLWACLGAAVLTIGAVPSEAEILNYEVTLTFGDVASDGLAPGTGDLIFSDLLCLNGATVGCFSGNFDSSGDKTWTSSGTNSITLSADTDRFYDQGGNNGSSYYNAYDELVDGAQDYSAFGQPDCTTATFLFHYSCSQPAGKGITFKPTVVANVGPAAQASGVVTVDTDTGTLTGDLTVAQFGFRFGDGSPFNAAQDVPSGIGTLTLNLTGTFTPTSWDVTGGNASYSDPAFVCNAGDLSGVLCNESTTNGGHQNDGSHLSWRDIPIFDNPETLGGSLVFTLPGVVLSATLSGGGQITASDGEYHRWGGNSGGGCLNSVWYRPDTNAIGCGSITAGIFAVAGQLVSAANDDSATTRQDVPVTIDILANDSGFTDPVTITLDTTGTAGTPVVNGSPGNQADIDVTYTPAPGFTGTDTFDYTVADSGGGPQRTATVTVEVTPFGAVDDAATTRLNTAVDIDVLGNDVGLEDPVSVVVTIAPDQGGDAVVNGSPGNQAAVNITFTPSAAAGTAGYTETFTYEVTDNLGGVATALVTVTVENQLPAANAADITDIDTTGVDPATQSSDLDVAAIPGNALGDEPSTVSASDGAQGSVAVAGTTVTYTPAASFFAGTDTFQYTITDDDGETASAAVTVTIPDVAPVLQDASATTDEDEPVDVALSVTPGNGSPGQHTIAVSADAANGACSLNGFTVTYTPDAGYRGGDSCEVTLTDGDGDGATATVSVTVNAVDPTAANASGETDQDTAVDIVAAITLGSGTSAEHSVAIVTDAANGSCSADITSNTAVTVSYTPDADFAGTDSCVYELSDRNGDADTGTVTITVNEIGDIEIRLSGGSSALDPWALLLLGGLPLIRRRRR